MGLARATINPNDITLEYGQMKASWPVEYTRESVGHLGEKMVVHESVFIPDNFAPIIEEAKAQGRLVRVTYKAIFGSQAASTVEML